MTYRQIVEILSNYYIYCHWFAVLHNNKKGSVFFVVFFSLLLYASYLKLMLYGIVIYVVGKTNKI